MSKNTQKLKLMSEDRQKNSKVLAVMNNKGGVGKTSTSIALGMSLVKSGKNVLFWDNDPQSNLTQRMGMPDDLYGERRLNHLFLNYKEPDHEIIHIIKYPGLRTDKEVDKLGIIGLMAGSHDAELDAATTFLKFNKKTFDIESTMSVYKWFLNNIQYYNQYFDYIIIDTAPALEGNRLNTLACSVVDDFIIPIDSIDAALGMRTLLSWLYSMARDTNKKEFNATIAMVKYQMDIKPDDSLIIRNKVFRILKDIFDGFVCDNGVREKATERKAIAGFKGSKNGYLALISEIMFKFAQENRPNLFKSLTPEKFLTLELKLNLLQNEIQTKEPEFKGVVFEAIKEIKDDMFKTSGDKCPVA